MWEAVVCILLVNSIWIPVPIRVRLTGLPLALGIMLFAWVGNLLPPTCYKHELHHPFRVLLKTFSMTLVVDFLQTWIHKLSHTTLRSTRVGKSHMIHHLAREPTPYDAFATGYLDALLQLILPIFISIYMLFPDRTTLTLFGSFYSCWLHFLHSPPRPWHNKLGSIGLVTPDDHQTHHKKPNLRFANVFKLYDNLI